MSARDEILSRLTATLARHDLAFPPHDARPLARDERMTVTSGPTAPMDLAQRFGEELEALHGSYEIVATVPGARMACVNRIMSWIDKEKSERRGMALKTGQEMDVLGWHPEQLALPGIEEVLEDVGLRLVTPESVDSAEDRDAIRLIRFGITGVEAAFASTGSMMMASSEAGANRIASLMPFRHLALIPFSKLYPTPEAWMAELRQFGNFTDWIRSHANLSMITGPSKSADLEGNLTLGVHGPKFVHAVLFDDIGGLGTTRPWDTDDIGDDEYNW